MNRDVASLLAYKLRRLADASPQDAAVAIRDLLEQERMTKCVNEPEDANPPTILHHGRQRPGWYRK